MLKKLLFCSAVAFAGALFAADAPVIAWKFPENAKDWNILRNVKVIPGDNCANLLSTKFDRSIGIAKLNIDAAKVNMLRVYYRADGFKVRRTTGQLFFGPVSDPRFIYKRNFELPSLIVDGKKQVLTLRLDSQQVYKRWLEGGKIATLRLDIADQHPGNVYVEKVELLYRDPNSKILTWDFADGPGDWNTGHKLKLSWENNALLQESTANDGKLFNNKCRFPGKNYTKLRVVYRAQGLPKRTDGQFFYTSTVNKRHAYERRSVIPSLISDGKTHEFTIKTPWGDEQITSLRLDMVDQHPGKIWIEKIELLP